LGVSFGQFGHGPYWLGLPQFWVQRPNDDGEETEDDEDDEDDEEVEDDEGVEEEAKEDDASEVKLVFETFFGVCFASGRFRFLVAVCFGGVDCLVGVGGLEEVELEEEADDKVDEVLVNNGGGGIFRGSFEEVWERGGKDRFQAGCQDLTRASAWLSENTVSG
jgi:hypothetical protein